MRSLIVGISMLLLSGCSELDCFSSGEFSVKQADKFCAQASKNDALCGSLTINDKKVCAISKQNSDKCIASNEGIEIFTRIPLFKCNQLDETQCKKDEECEWTLVDAGPLSTKRDLDR